MLLLVFDLLGTFVFGLSGGLVGVGRRLDLLGVLVLAFAAALAGGIARDLLIGAVPPNGVSDWRYPVVAFAAGLVTFFWHRSVKRLRRAVLVFDALGLGFFAVTGAQKALAFGLNPLMAVLLGALTAVGGGTARDLLVAEVPTVLRREIYAVAALIGATIEVVGRRGGLPAAVPAVAGAAACVVVRLVAVWRGWHMPQARPE